MLNLSQQHPVVNEESKPFEFPNIDFRMNENLFALTIGKFWKLLRDSMKKVKRKKK